MTNKESGVENGRGGVIRPVVPVRVAMTLLDLTDDAAAGLSCALIGVSGRTHGALFGTRGSLGTLYRTSR